MAEPMKHLEMKYFVLKPSGASVFARASRNAMRAYASTIRSNEIDFANELMDWIEREEARARLGEKP